MTQTCFSKEEANSAVDDSRISKDSRKIKDTPFLYVWMFLGTLRNYNDANVSGDLLDNIFPYRLQCFVYNWSGNRAFL